MNPTKPRLLLAFAIAATLALAGCSNGNNNAGATSPPGPAPTPAPPPDPIAVVGNVSDSPVVGGSLYVFTAATIAAALAAADAAAASERAAALAAAGPIATLARTAADGPTYSLQLDGTNDGQALFVVFDSGGATDQQFGDTPLDMEAVVIGASGNQRINVTPHTSLIAQQVRAELDPAGSGTPINAAAVRGAIDSARANVLSALNRDGMGRQLFADGTDPTTLEDIQVLDAASSAIGLLVRTAATIGGFSRGAALAALSADAEDGTLDGMVPADFSSDPELLARVATVRSVQSANEPAEGAGGACSSAAVALNQACGFDVLDDFLTSAAICADTSDPERQADCVADARIERTDATEACADQFEARLDLCNDLDDAAHEPAFGPGFADGFVDPLQIGLTVEPNPFFPLIPGNTWEYESTFMEDGEEVTETIEVTVTNKTKLIQGITCIVVTDVVEEDGELIEDTDDWFAQDNSGHVWYCGEIAQNFETFDGDEPDTAELVDIDGSWKAGRDGSKAGILLPFSPNPGDVIRQEVAFGEAEDVIEIMSITGTEMAPAGGCDSTCLITRDFTPIEPDSEAMKFYAPGLGLIVEIEDGARVELVSFENVPPNALSAAKLLIEHNATDEDTGFQGFADGSPYHTLTVTGPDDANILTVRAAGGLAGFGLTELFFETSEPPNAEVPIMDVLERLPVGDYTFTSEPVGGDGPDSGTAMFSQAIPAGPELISPADEATGLSPDGLVLSWSLVDTDINAAPLEVIGYQVILEEDAPAPFPSGFAKPVLSVYLPADATRVTMPDAFVTDDTCYSWEVLAIEATGNQTLSSAGFETGSCSPAEEMETEGLKAGKLLIEHNATDEDTGFQAFTDGDPWNVLTISGPGETPIATFNAGGGLLDFGLTELFFETSEPPNDEVSIMGVLERLPAGDYTFSAEHVDVADSTFTAAFSHAIPEGPVLLTPADESEDVDPANTVVSWEAVTTDLDGEAVTIVGYQVIVEVDEEPAFPQGFAAATFSVYLPADSRSVLIPAEFMTADTDYKYEVLAIEASGNQTLSAAAFSTAGDEEE